MLTRRKFLAGAVTAIAAVSAKLRPLSFYPSAASVEGIGLPPASTTTWQHFTIRSPDAAPIKIFGVSGYQARLGKFDLKLDEPYDLRAGQEITLIPEKSDVESA